MEVGIKLCRDDNDKVKKEYNNQIWKMSEHLKKKEITNTW